MMINKTSARRFYVRLTSGIHSSAVFPGAILVTYADSILLRVVNTGKNGQEFDAACAALVAKLKDWNIDRGGYQLGAIADMIEISFPKGRSPGTVRYSALNVYHSKKMHLQAMLAMAQQGEALLRIHPNKKPGHIVRVYAQREAQAASAMYTVTHVRTEEPEHGE